MIKAEVKIPAKPPIPIEYPILMNEANLVVLFISPNTGVVILPAPPYNVGHFDKNWDQNRFDIYPKAVELYNE